MTYTDGKCNICHGTGYVTHVNLPVYGSEGVDLCEACLGTVCNMVNALAATALRAHRNAVMMERRKREKVQS